MVKAPIAVLAFNRPGFLSAVLESLRAQRHGTLDGREVHLFQDGARNRYSGLRYASDADIAASIAAFQAAFPQGIIHASGDNVGICENYKQAEEYFFRERDLDCAYFFEDDMVLSPVYLQMMEILQAYAESSRRVAYFAAYGDYYAGLEEIAARRRSLITLDHHWGFGLLRHAWLEMQPLLADYYALVVGQDYARRDHRAIYALYGQQDAAPRGSSQDAAKAFACDRLGTWRCRTLVPFARYIGTTGAHMTQQAYDAIGFANTVVAREAITDLVLPDAAEVAAYLGLQRALFTAIRRDELPEVIAKLPARELNPMRRATADDVRAAYRLLLHREPESEAIIAQHAGRSHVAELVRGVLGSEEYQRLQARMAP